MKRSPPLPGDDSFPMPQKTRGPFPAESSGGEGRVRPSEFVQLLCASRMQPSVVAARNPKQAVEGRTDSFRLILLDIGRLLLYITE
jgi:hypothetical protein